MDKFRQINKDKKIIEIYNQISEFEDLDKGWAYHNLDHVRNVANLVEILLKKLNYDVDFIDEAKVAALLHDVGAIEGKYNHAQRSYEFTKAYLKDNNILLDNEEQVLEAIKIHSDGFDSDNIIALALILSDKLDIKYTRVATEGYNVKGMREIQYINDILIDIKNQNLEINFICDDNINKKELEEFYFTLKVFKSIIAFSKKMCLTPKVLFNDLEWKLFNDIVN